MTQWIPVRAAATHGEAGAPMNRAAGARAGKSPLGWIARVASGLAMAVALLQPAQPAAAREGPPVLLDGMGTIAEQRLPNEARVTLQRIESGGPFPYAKDGTRFGNYERLLPRKPRGYYREYTVAKPNSRSRGPKRIVCGGPQRMVDDCYYTEDHYNSFKRITR